MMTARQIVCLGLSHRTAPVEVRERLRCSLIDVGQLLPMLDDSIVTDYGRFSAISEAVILSTCNRMEFYTVVDTDEDPRQLMVDLLGNIHPANLDEMGDQVYFYAGETAVTHLLRVAAGLDSLILGEPQILGQVTDAYMAAVKAHTIGPMLDALFQTAIRSGKRVRTETAISTNPASISSVAIALAKEVVGSLHDKHILVIGSGEMARLAIKAIHARSVGRMSVANRTISRAETLASGSGGYAYGLDQLPHALAVVDVVISATAAPTPVVDGDMVAEAMVGREERPLVLIDIAVPRDIDPEAGKIPGVYLFDVDDLQTTLDDSLDARKAEIPGVEAILEQEKSCLDMELRTLTVKPLIADLHQKAEAIRQRELERTLRYLGDVDPQTLEHLQHLTRSLVTKLLHEPTKQLRTQAGSGTAVDVSTVRELFGLTGGD
jgi:glutamyl-tRNA reductase